MKNNTEWHELIKQSNEHVKRHRVAIVHRLQVIAEDITLKALIWCHHHHHHHHQWADDVDDGPLCTTWTQMMSDYWDAWHAVDFIFSWLSALEVFVSFVYNNNKKKKKLSYHRETRVTLCVSWNVGLLLCEYRKQIACQTEEHFQQLTRFIPLPA